MLGLFIWGCLPIFMAYRYWQYRDAPRVLTYCELTPFLFAFIVAIIYGISLGFFAIDAFYQCVRCQIDTVSTDNLPRPTGDVVINNNSNCQGLLKAGQSYCPELHLNILPSAPPPSAQEQQDVALAGYQLPPYEEDAKI